MTFVTNCTCVRYSRLTVADKAVIRDFYENTPEGDFDLNSIAKKLGRTRQFISRHAGKMGLTKRRPHNSSTIANFQKAHAGKWSVKPHPRGALGLVHSAEAREKMSAVSLKAWATAKTFGTGLMAPEIRQNRREVASRNMALRDASTVHTRAAGGRREDIGEIWFRSSWEANYARYLNLLVKMKLVDSWAYEPETFWFEGVKRGCVSYKPDFRVIYRNDPRPEYIEIKGWTTDKDRTKWKRMAKYHSHIKLVVIAEKEYRQIQDKWSSALPNWEKGKRA